MLAFLSFRSAHFDLKHNSYKQSKNIIKIGLEGELNIDQSFLQFNVNKNLFSQ